MPKLTTVSESLIELCKARKEELGMTNATIAENTGIPESTITKLFNNTIRSPSVETVIPIARVLNISIDTMTVIKKGSEPSSPPVVQNVGALSPIIEQFNKQLAESYEKQLKAKRENYDRQIKQTCEHYERQIKIITDSYERHITTLINGYERPLRTKNKWIIALAATIILIALSLVGSVVYDILNPDKGWIQYALEHNWISIIKRMFTA